MSYETRDNTGRLFRVDEDKKREQGPDYSGTALIDGTEYFMDAWLKTAESGRKWFSFSFKPKQKAADKQNRPQPAQPQRPARQAQRPAFDEMDDDIPF